MSAKLFFVRIAVALLLVPQLTGFLSAASRTPIQISNRYSPLNKKRPNRLHTRYIVLHTTEGEEKGSLGVVTRSGLAHYFVSMSGRVYRIIDKSKIAKHAGRSMWEGISTIDNYSIGIEVSGYHDKDITDAQYEALRELLRQLKSLYDIPDEDVITHSMVAYGRPNHFYKYNHRGRKRCGMLFAKPEVRARLGLNASPDRDADVAAGRLKVADKELFSVLFPEKKNSISVVASAAPATMKLLPVSANPEISSAAQASAAANIVPAALETAPLAEAAKPAAEAAKPAAEAAKPAAEAAKPASSETASLIPSAVAATREIEPLAVNTKAASPGSESEKDSSKLFFIDGNRSAWEIARENYNHQSTLYIFPGGKQMTGDQIEDWAHIPANTRVIIEEEEDPQLFEGFLEIGRDGDTAKEVAGMASTSSTTIYFFPDGLIRTGSELSSRRSYQKLLNNPPKKTKVLIGYVYGGYVKSRRPPSSIAGVKWNYPSTYYRYPDGNIVDGDDINDKEIPPGTLIFYQR